VTLDDRPGGNTRAWWTGDGEQAGKFTLAYKSVWLSARLLESHELERLADALFATSRNWSVSLHFNKGLAGAPEDAIAAAKKTAMSPAVAEAFALAIISGSGPSNYPSLPQSKPLDVSKARKAAADIQKAMATLRNATSSTGSYLAEADYFDEQWQTSFWGKNYSRLRALKEKFDPDGLFFVHHGVGSEDWSADGFTQVKKL
jgi:FAD/FMN-containing dehydrogenase